MESLGRANMEKVSFIFVPGHAGVRGNEQADRLAGRATGGSGHAMDRTDILNALREAGRVNDFSNDCVSATMTRLQEHQVKRGTARQERYAGSQRRIVNQHRTGAVSRYTLREILRRGSEHLWTEQFDVQ